MKRGVGPILVVLGVAAVVVLSLPPRALVLAEGGAPQGLRGAIHVHTRQSDGSGTPYEVAAAAARAGLKFVILTDHGDASAEPSRPFYRGGVLVIEGVEISTDGGHLIALGLPKAPYPLAGEARDVVDDVHRLGGLAIAAHPESPKPALRWSDWEPPVDGVEWLNADSDWRDETVPALARALLAYPFRSVETLGHLVDRPSSMLERWDSLTVKRRLVAVAGADAHARISLRSGGSEDRGPALRLPSYETMLRTFSISVAAALTGDPIVDGKAVIDAIAAGHVYSSLDALAAPAAFRFVARIGGREVAQGGDVIPAGMGAIELHADSNAPEGAELVLLANGKPVHTARGSRLRHTIDGSPAVYRVEIRLAGRPDGQQIPWILSNPIYVGVPMKGGGTPRAGAARVVSRYADGPASGWSVAHSARSVGAIDVVAAAGGTQILFRWGLGGTRSESPYAAAVMPALELTPFDRLMFTARADRPMRLSVQVRAPGTAEGSDGERWHRSIYVDDDAREVTVFFDDMTPRGKTSHPRPDLGAVRDVIFVVDTVNTHPGTSGQVLLDDIRYGAP